MGTTPNYGWTYPDPTSNAEIWTHFEVLADLIDASLQALQDDLDALVPVEVESSDNNPSPLSTTSTPALGATTCKVDFVAPPSGRVQLGFNATFTPVGGTGQLYMGPQVRAGTSASSGTIVFNPAADPGAKVGGTLSGVQALGLTRLLTGLTPGATYNAAATYFNVSGSSLTINYFSRYVSVTPTF